LRRALERELFEQQGLQRIVTGGGPTLDVELVAFEELRGKPTRARVTLRFSLHDERRSLLERSIDVEREVAARAGSDEAARLAQTLSTTLGDAVAAVAQQVGAELEAAKQSAPAPAAP
jgi:cholesterol transport system auxiliary component